MTPTERTPESYAIWLAESPREVDAWVAEVVMGWKLTPVDALPSHDEWIDSTGRSRGKTWYFNPTTDANAADLVRERVAMLERDFQVSWVYRVAVLSMQSGMMVDAMIHARPPHYVGAAWLLGDEVWRELRERGTITP